MNALELLGEQHDEMDDLFDRIAQSREADERERLFTELADKLAAHAAIEEKIFYPAVKTEQTETLLGQAVEEHLAIKRVLADLIDLEPDDPHFDAKLVVMREQVRHHARDEEEAVLFPEVERACSADELEGLGGELAAMYDDLIEQHPRMQVFGETAQAASI